ncbi:hypothetical protein, partial [Flagellimonas nanhaiensis]
MSEDEIITFIKNDTGQELNDFKDWKLGNCLDLISRISEEFANQQNKSTKEESLELIKFCKSYPGML